MKKFGKESEFALWVNNHYLLYKNEPLFLQNPEKYEMDGDVYFWVKNKNIFEYADCESPATYWFDLNTLIRFFCENLSYHITDDPFPIPTKTSNAIAMMNEVSLIDAEEEGTELEKLAEVDWDNIDMELQEEIYEWNTRHGLLANRDGSLLPHAYIRKVNDKIEISWDTTFAHDNGDREFYFVHKKGVEYIDIKLYRDTVIQFCVDFINKFKDKYPDITQKYSKSLQKAIDIIL